MKTNRAFTALAVLSLALGIGANTALFSVVHTAVLAELPLPDADQLLTFRWVGPNDVRANGRSYGTTPPDPVAGRAGSEFSFAVFEQFRSVNETLTDLAAFAPAVGLNVVADGIAEAVAGRYVSGNYYDVLGVSVFAGRPISVGDDTTSASPVVVLSYKYWESRFQADPAIIGSSILINGLSFTVVGVAASGERDPSGMGRPAPAVSMPLAVEARLPKTNQTLMTQRATWWLLLMGRSKEGVTREQVRANFEPVFQSTVRDDWEAYRNAFPDRPQRTTGEPQIPGLRVVVGAHGVYGVPQQALVGIGILGVIFGVVLFVVCINLAALLLSRMTARQNELMVRKAIGASRGRVVRQLLTENVVLAVIGGALGVLVAYWCLSFLPSLLPPLTRSQFTNQWDLVQINWLVFGFAETVASLTVILFGLGPALRASRADAALTVGSASTRYASGRSRLGRGLLTAEVALSLLLLVSAGLFLRTLTNLRSVAVGFNPDNVLVFTIDPQVAGYDSEQAGELYERLLEQLEAMPEVRAASYSGFAPLTGSNRRTNVFFANLNSEPTNVATVNVHHEFFRTMEIPLLEGPGFTANDGPDTPRVAVVNEAFVRTFLSDADPVGSRFGTSSTELRDIEIVGVVADAKFSSLRDPAGPVFYSPASQGFGSSRRTFAVRTAIDPERMAATVSDAVRSLDGQLPVLSLSAYLEGIESTLIRERIFSAAASLFGTLTLVLSMTGLFGLMSYSVARQTKEIGIRMALGAERGTVLRKVLRESLTLTGVGILIGLAAVLAVTPLIGRFLFGLPPHDPATILSVVLLMLFVATLAAYLPARHASRVDPVVALRHD